MSSAKDWREVKATAALRDRIAAAIEAQHVSEYQGGIHPEDVLRVADAVIAELRHEFWLHDESRWLRADDE